MVFKHIFNVLFLLLCTHICAQEKAAIKIFVTDAETGKQIKNAKVTLEGFEISPLEGQYNEEENYYYFNTVPEGYNTVMAYHKKYNEKGFQDIGGLPQEISLALHDPLNMRYSFEDDKRYGVYVEDPYKIVILSDSITDYNQFVRYLTKSLNSITSVKLFNPGLETHTFLSASAFPIQSQPYPEIDFPNDQAFNLNIITMAGGYDNIEHYADISIDLEADKVAFYVRKNNGSKFKRFNDPDILLLEQIKGIQIVMAVNIKVPIQNYQTSKQYHKKYIKLIDEYNSVFKKADSSKVFFYSTEYFIFTKDKITKPPIVSDKIDSRPRSKIVLVDRKNFESMFYKIEENGKKIIPLKEKGIGLGILDYYEYMAVKNNKRFSINDIRYY